MDRDEGQKLKACLDHMILFQAELHDDLIGDKESKPKSKRNDVSGVDPGNPAFAWRHWGEGGGGKKDCRQK